MGDQSALVPHPPEPNPVPDHSGLRTAGRLRRRPPRLDLGGEIGAAGIHERFGDLVDAHPQVLDVAEVRGCRRGAMEHRDIVG